MYGIYARFIDTKIGESFNKRKEAEERNTLFCLLSSSFKNLLWPTTCRKRPSSRWIQGCFNRRGWSRG